MMPAAVAEFVRRYGVVMSASIVLTCAVWVLVIVVLPQILMVDYSFRPSLPPSRQGGPEDVYTLKNYVTLFSNPINLAIFFKTIWSSALVTAVALAVCYPIAYYLAQVASGRRAALLVLGLIVPYWVNEILRAFAWFLMMARNGLFNTVLTEAGLIAEPITFLGTIPAVLVGMVYAYVLFMVFPIYSSLESLDRNQVEAARDLGAGWWRIHWRIAIPHAKPGIAVGCIMTFMLAAGSYAVPAILGGPQSRWFTEVIYAQFFEGLNWNQGAAYAFILLVLCILFILAMMRLFRVGLTEIAR
ncbi:ABC transporter permease [Virgifigura deserti]|uniref:ABC transporter permease n=1 Tax=Virgifigura deserti TaxID=2268457 RepID=UPI003CCC467C